MNWDDSRVVCVQEHCLAVISRGERSLLVRIFLSETEPGIAEGLPYGFA